MFKQERSSVWQPHHQAGRVPAFLVWGPSSSVPSQRSNLTSPLRPAPRATHPFCSSKLTVAKCHQQATTTTTTTSTSPQTKPVRLCHRLRDGIASSHTHSLPCWLCLRLQGRGIACLLALTWSSWTLEPSEASSDCGEIWPALSPPRYWTD